MAHIMLESRALPEALISSIRGCAGICIRWVQLPLHHAIMRRYRTRGTILSTLWESETPDRSAILLDAERRLAGDDFS
jgi:hypothetical protein